MTIYQPRKTWKCWIGLHRWCSITFSFSSWSECIRCGKRRWDA